MKKSDSIKNLATALNKAQAVMGGAKKGKVNPFFKSKYADLSAVQEVIQEPFSEHGLSYVQFPIEYNGRIGVETTLMHESGEWMSNEFTVNLTKQDAQGAGSAITYCRRYALQAMAGIPSEDDDGNKASPAHKPQQRQQAPQKADPSATISPAQVKRLQTIRKCSDERKAKVLKHYGFSSTTDVLLTHHDVVAKAFSTPDPVVK